MKKKLLSVTMIILGANLAYSQTGHVGINTIQPAATLDVAGTPTTATKADGIIAPRISRANLSAKTAYSAAQNAAMIYVDTLDGSASGQTTNVTAIGYYYFDATQASNAGRWMAFTSASAGGGTGTVTNVTGTSPINVATGTTTPVVSITRNDLIAGNSVATATEPLTVNNGTNAVVNGSNSSLTVNNTAPIWNANQLLSRPISSAVAPSTTNNTLQYDGTAWVPVSLPTPVTDWHIAGNTDAEINGNGSTLGSTLPANYIGIQAGADPLVLATAGKTHAILSSNGTLTGGGEATSSLSWGSGNTVGTANNIALGLSNNASAGASVAIGEQNTATTGAGNIGIGYKNVVTGSNGGNMSIGNLNTISGTGGNMAILGNSNSMINTSGGNGMIFGSQNSSLGAALVIGQGNGSSAGTPIAAGYTYGSNNISNTGGYIYGNLNKITTTGAPGSSYVFGSNGTVSTSNTTLNSNGYHNFLPQNNTGKTLVGINVDAAALTGNATQNDLTVNNSIRIISKPANNVNCDSANEGAMRFVNDAGNRGLQVCIWGSTVANQGWRYMILSTTPSAN